MRTFTKFLLGAALAAAAFTACGGSDGGASTDDVAATADTTGSADVQVEKDSPSEAIDPTPVTCTITTPVSGAVLGADVAIEVATTGGADEVVLLANGAEAGRSPVGADGTASFAYAASAEGDSQVMVKALRADGASAFSSVVVVTIDLTPPVVSVPLERFTVVKGSVALAAQVTDLHPDSLRLVGADGAVLATAFPGTSDLLFTSTEVADGAHDVHVEATDLAGNTGASAPLVFVVANNGEELEVEYIPMAKVSVPENWQTAEYHTRVMSEVRPGVKRILTWVTWDPSGDWQMEYSVGQGTCPHNGIQYLAKQSRAGEILIDLRRAALDPAIVAKFPVEEQTSDVFPINADPATFGSFFSHVAPLDPADHVGQSVDIQAGTVVFF